MGDIESRDDEVLVGEVIDEPQPERPRKGKGKYSGNGMRVSFADMTPEERKEMSRRGTEAQRRKRHVRQLAKLDAYREAHRELMAQVLGTKMVLLDGLIEEMKDPDSGDLDTARLNDKRMNVLLSLMKQLEKAAFPDEKVVNEKKVVEHNVNVDVRHVIAEINKGLMRPDDV